MKGEEVVTQRDTSRWCQKSNDAESGLCVTTESYTEELASNFIHPDVAFSYFCG